MKVTVRTYLLAGLVAAGMTVSGVAQAQQPVRLTIDSKSSLAWWQVNPHMEHLWATTCAQDPSWRPGEGASSGWATDFLSKGMATGHSSKLVDSSSIPLYPRRRVRPLCNEAVSGDVTIDTLNWSTARGTVTVKADQLTTGTDMRDNYAKKSILTTSNYPDIKFTIDSLGPMTKKVSVKGDTLRGDVFGTFELRGVKHPMKASARTTHEAGGLRVRAKFMMGTRDMVEVYNMSKVSLGLGVVQSIWEELWMGVDVLLKVPGTP
ncbi:MAG: hypothetical protein EXR93_11620 [Gemmatimonadetes bacterium]|nr:hypothetical protein [Gemmatimonadota bacterium]